MSNPTRNHTPLYKNRECTAPLDLLLGSILCTFHRILRTEKFKLSHFNSTRNLDEKKHTYDRGYSGEYADG